MTAGWVDANVMPTLAQNTATSGLSGWRWGNPVSVTGNVYKFYGDLSLLNTPPALLQGYTIEYFIIAETQDGLVTDWSSGDWSHNVFPCPSTVKLETYSPIPVPYDNVATNMDSNSVQDRFSIYGGTDLKRGIELVNINVTNTYTGANLIPPASASTAVATVCSGDSIQVVAHYTIIGDSIGNAPGTTHLFEVADNNTFTTGLQSFVQDDSTFRYHMVSATPKYIRVSYVCGGSTAVSGSTTPFVTIQSSNIPVNTSAIPDQNSCASLAKSITLTSTAVPATLSRYNWVVDNQGKMYPATPTASTTGSAAISVTPTDVTRTGTWTSYVTPSAGSNINDLGYHALQLSANEASDLRSGKGLQLVVNKIVKLNGLNVKARTGDGTTTNGFNISIYSETGSRIYTVSNSGAIADGTVKAFTFNNWYLSPGTYSLVIEPTTPGTDPTGALANASVSLPMDGTNVGSPALFIQAGVSDLSIDTANNYHFSYAVSNEYSYFYDLDITAFCTSNPLTFKWDISPASCCLVPLPTVGLIAPNAQSNDLSKYHCGSDVSSRIYYFDSTITNKLLLAVYANGNEWEPSVVMVSNNGLLSDSTHCQSNGTDSMEVMPYIVQIEHEPTLDTSITVRLFYPLADKLFIQNHYPNAYWFKYEGSAQDILNNLNPTYLDGIQILMPSDTGIENGKPYVEFEGVSTFSSFGFIGATTNTVLPINFNNFTVGINGCSAWVQWKSSTELNIASYEVEESFDGKTFVSLASFAAQGDNHSYTASLPTNISRGSCYYRLKMIDKKGISKYSKILVVNVDCEAEPSNIQAYPNPAKNNVNVTLNVEKGDYVLTFVNAVGQTVFQQPVKVNSKGQQLPIKNLHLIGKGSFMLKLTHTISRESFITRLQML